MKLYLVPTPIGNLEDITMRALRVLREEVDVILAEDTRTSGNLLRHYNISKPMSAFHINNEHKVVRSFAERIRAGEKMALVTDAGTPAISDPGFLLVRECIRLGVEVECLPGATAFVPALVNSGLSADHFIFEGFLPHKKGRQTKLNEIAKQPLYDNTLRVSIPPREDIAATHRSVWSRPSRVSSTRTYQNIRRECERYARRSARIFQSERSERRDRDGG